MSGAGAKHPPRLPLAAQATELVARGRALLAGARERIQRHVTTRTSRPLKRCICGRVYTFSEWLELPLAGEMRVARQLLELRHCACGSTLALFVRP